MRNQKSIQVGDRIYHLEKRSETICKSIDSDKKGLRINGANGIYGPEWAWIRLDGEKEVR